MERLKSLHKTKGMSGPAVFRKEGGRPSGEVVWDPLDRRIAVSISRGRKMTSWSLFGLRFGKMMYSGSDGVTKDDAKCLLKMDATSGALTASLPLASDKMGMGIEDGRSRLLYKRNRALGESLRAEFS